MSFLTASWIIPFFVLLGSVTIDLQGYTVERARMQEITDDAVLIGSKYLPNLPLAEEAVRGVFSSRDPSATAIVSAKDDSLMVEGKGVFRPFLAGYFSAFTSNDLTLPVHTIGYGRITPIDVYVALERGARVAPSLQAAEDERFGQENEFPVAPIFLSQPRFHSGQRIDPNIATEQCFNPRFAKIKLGRDSYPRCCFGKQQESNWPFLFSWIAIRGWPKPAA